MKNHISVFIGISLLVLVVASGCGSNYETEMKAAQDAMDKAKSTFAEDVAAEDWSDAMQAWEEAQAAVKQGKNASALFLRAKSRFEKTARIAKASAQALSKEISETQLRIGERSAKLSQALERNEVAAKIRDEAKSLVQDIEREAPSIDAMITEGNLVKAMMLARDLQAKLYKAELLISGKKK